MTDQPLLEARKIVKSFGNVQALTGANFSVFPGEVVALVGDNGAGKSTLVKTLVGVHPPDSGEAAKALTKLIGGSGKVFVINVKPGISTTDAREKGFVEGAKAAGLEYVGREYSNDKPEVAAAKVKAALQKDSDLKGIFATNLFAAEGAASAATEAGAKVKIVGFDAGPKQVKDLEAGTVQALIAQKPAEIGSLGVEQAFNALEGKPTKEKIGTGATTITKDNLADSQDALYKPSC